MKIMRTYLLIIITLLSGCASTNSVSQYGNEFITPEFVEKKVKVGRTFYVTLTDKSTRRIEVEYKDERTFGANKSEAVLYSDVKGLSVERTGWDDFSDTTIAIVTFPFLLIGSLFGIIDWST